MCVHSHRGSATEGLAEPKGVQINEKQFLWECVSYTLEKRNIKNLNYKDKLFELDYMSLDTFLLF